MVGYGMRLVEVQISLKNPNKINFLSGFLFISSSSMSEPFKQPILPTQIITLSPVLIPSFFLHIFLFLDLKNEVGIVGGRQKILFLTKKRYFFAISACLFVAKSIFSGKIEKRYEEKISKKTFGFCFKETTLKESIGFPR